MKIEIELTNEEIKALLLLRAKPVDLLKGDLKKTNERLMTTTHARINVINRILDKLESPHHNGS